MSDTTNLDPASIVIFGITGDLSQRYLLPALYHLIKEGLLHEDTEIIGVTRRDVSVEEVLNDKNLCGEEPDGVCDTMAFEKMRSRTRMVQMNLTEIEDYRQLHATLNAIEDEKGLCMNRLYYLSIPPQVYGPIVDLMGEVGLNTSCQHGRANTRLLVEKPFGYDSKSAEALITDTGNVFGEGQMYRIDHYLAKETVQNILAFRFQNPIFEALWNKDHIAGIEISAGEQIGIEGRANFYESIGALRDLIQSHLLQVMGIVTMDKPAAMDSDHIHASKQQVLEQAVAVPADQVAQHAFRAQYDGYRTEVNNPESTTETFAAIRVYIDNDRWQGVPITIWTGKALDEKKTEVSVTFKGEGEKPNKLRFRIQPNEGIELDLLAKKPGYENDLQTAAMDFSYRQIFDNHGHPNAYERVLVDAVRGDHTLFATSQEVLSAWRVVQPVLTEWGKQGSDMDIYPKGATGEDMVHKKIGDLLN